MIKALLSVSLAATMLAGCSRQPDPAPQPSAAPGAPGSVVLTPARPPSQSMPTGLPAAMHGRFGMVPADCTTTKGDDKGLVTVSAEGLKFYESVARLVEAEQRTADHVSGRFAYSGEGMEWTRTADLDLRDGGNTLVLKEYGGDAVPGPQVFKRCPA